MIILQIQTFQNYDRSWEEEATPIKEAQQQIKMNTEELDKLPMFWTDDPKVQLEEYYQDRKLFAPIRHVIHRLTANTEKYYRNYHRTLQVRYFNNYEQALLKHQERDYLDQIATAAKGAELQVTYLYDRCIVITAPKSARKTLKTKLFYQTALKYRYSHSMTRHINEYEETQGAPPGKAPRTAIGEPKPKTKPTRIPEKYRIHAPNILEKIDRSYYHLRDIDEVQYSDRRPSRICKTCNRPVEQNSKTYVRDQQIQTEPLTIPITIRYPDDILEIYPRPGKPKQYGQYDDYPIYSRRNKEKKNKDERKNARSRLPKLHYDPVYRAWTDNNLQEKYQPTDHDPRKNTSSSSI